MLATALACGLLLSGCKIEDVFPVSAALQQKIDSQQRTIGDLQKQLANLDSQLNAQHTAENIRISNIESKVLSLWFDANYPSATRLSVTERNYSVVKTAVGSLLFVVQDMTPYANGVKLKLKIGNPNAVNFDGIKINFSWGKDAKDALSNNKEVDVPTVFVSGAWTFQDVVLTPAKTNEMGYLSVSASTNQIGLRPPYPSK